MLLVVIPTYNEIDNIRLIVPAVMAVIPPDASILVADDASPDGTGEAVKEMQTNFPGRLYLKEGSGKQGLANAYISSFKWAMDKANVGGKEFDVFLEMDADFSHKPEYIPLMLKELDSHDVVIGSRNIKGGAVEGWSALRNFISKGVSLYSRMVLSCPIRDLTGGFNMWTRKALDRIGLDSIISKGYSFQIEMKYRAYKAGCSIKEIPIVFPDRQRGKSKMDKGIFTEALKAVWKIRKECCGKRSSRQLVKRYIFLHLTFLEYAFAGIFMKKATLCGGLNVKALMFFCTGIILFGGYSILWQQVLKSFPLSVAMANKPVCLLWGTLFGFFLFGEAVTLRFLIGVAFIVTGIIIVSGEKSDA